MLAPLEKCIVSGAKRMDPCLPVRRLYFAFVVKEIGMEADTFISQDAFGFLSTFVWPHIVKI